jgi:hypothetical protein
MEIRGGRCPGAGGDAEVELCNLAAEFKGADADGFSSARAVEIRQKPAEPAKSAAGEQGGGERPAPRAISKT